MANPHFDRETITEDIGFKGPHFDESIKEKFSFGLPGLAQQSWSPGGEFGQQGEFQGWRGKEESTPYRQNWEYDNMPGGEFTTAPNIVSPFRYPQHLLDDVNILNPRLNSTQQSFDFWDDLFSSEQSNLDNWDLFHLMSNGYTLEEAQEILDTQLG